MNALGARLLRLSLIATLGLVATLGPSPINASAIARTADPSRIATSLAAPGAQLWVRRYNGLGNSNATALGVSPDKSKVFVTGESVGSTGNKGYATIAYNATTSAQLWVKRYNGGWFAFALAVSPDGSKVFVTGGSGGLTSGIDYATIAYNTSTGAQLWVKRYNGPANRNDLGEALGVSPDGSKVFVTGISQESTGRDDIATIAYKASTGAQLWITRYNGGAATALRVSPDGSKVFVTDINSGSTIAYNASTGAQLWLMSYLGLFVTALGVSRDGSKVFVTGRTEVGPTTGNEEYTTIAYNASTGAQLWVARHVNLAFTSESATALGVSPDGSKVFVTGGSQGPTGNGEYATIAYNASTGAQLWIMSYYYTPGNLTDFATALGVSPDGSKVFVTGGSLGLTSGIDYATIAYNTSTGAQLWVKRYNGPGNGNDLGHAIGVSPDGSKVFVTGNSVGSTGSYDYATIAYSIT